MSGIFPLIFSFFICSLLVKFSALPPIHFFSSSFLVNFLFLAGAAAIPYTDVSFNKTSLVYWWMVRDVCAVKAYCYLILRYYNGALHGHMNVSVPFLNSSKILY